MRALCWFAFLSILILALPGCAGKGSGLTDPMTARGQTVSIKTPLKALWDTREYLVHIPKSWDGSSPLPVIVALHGAFMTAEEFENHTGLSDLADDEGFLVIYPEGMGVFGYVQHWNAGYCCGKAQKEQVDDVGFIDYCLDEVAAHLPLDDERIYLAGLSNGGMLAFHYASQRPNRIAAIAVVASGLPEDQDIYEFPEKAMPLCMIHGTADITIPYEGGALKGQEGEGVLRFRSVRESIDDWRQLNGCIDPPHKKILHGEKLESSVWDSCGDNAPITLHVLDGFKHHWPQGENVSELPFEEGQPFSCTHLVWEFFQSVD